MSSGGRSLKPEEIEAARLFPLLTGLRCEELDGSSPESGLPDFSLWDGRTEIGTLEVTQHTNREALATIGAAAKLGRQLVGTVGTWRIDIEPSTQVRGLLARAQPLIESAVTAGETHVSRLGAVGPSLAVAGILHLTCLAPQGPDEALIIVSEIGGATSRDVLADAVEEAVAANSTKLGAAGGVERHLLVWLDWYAPAGADAMASSFAEGLPGEPPRTPSVALDCCVWLCVTGKPWAVRWQNSSGWDVVHGTAGRP